MLLVFLVLQPLLSAGMIPLALGGDVPAPLESLLVNVLAFLTAAAALLSRSAQMNVRPLKASVGALGGLTLLGVFQLLPLPEGVLSRIASVNLKIYHETAEILRPVAPALAPTPRISIAPGQTIAVLLRLCASIALLFAAASLCRSRSRRRVFGGALLAAGLGHAVVVAVGTDTPGPGLDPAAASLLLGIALAVAFGAAWAELLTGAERGVDSSDRAERLERRLLPMAIRIAAWLSIAAGLVLTGVASSIASAAMVGLILLAFASSRRGRSARPTATTIAVGLVVLAFTLGAQAAPSGGDPRAWASERELIWKTAIAAWREFPIVGSGFGSFAEAFRRVQPRELHGLVDRARSGALELAVTGGAVGVGLGAVALLSLMAAQLKAWKAQRHREESAIALAAFGAMLFFALANLAESSTPRLVELPLLSMVVGAGWSAAQARGGQIP